MGGKREMTPKEPANFLATTKGVAIVGYIGTGAILLLGIGLRVAWMYNGEQSQFGIDDSTFPKVSSAAVPVVTGSFLAFRNGLFGPRSPLGHRLLGVYMTLIPGWLVTTLVVLALSLLHQVGSSDLLVLLGGAAWAACVSYVATMLFEEDGQRAGERRARRAARARTERSEGRDQEEEATASDRGAHSGADDRDGEDATS